MRLIICFLVCLLFAVPLHAQQKLLHIFSSGANQAKSSSAYLIYNYGQVFPATSVNADRSYFLIQGFYANKGLVISDIFNADKGQSPQVLIYPNPVKDIVNVEIENEANIGIRIIDIYGKILFDSFLESGTSSLDISFLPKGTYLLHLRDDKNNKVGLFKIVKI